VRAEIVCFSQPAVRQVGLPVYDEEILEGAGRRFLDDPGSFVDPAGFVNLISIREDAKPTAAAEGNLRRKVTRSASTEAE